MIMESTVEETAVEKSLTPRGRRWRGSVGRLSLVVAGILLTQFILYGPSLLGWKVLLPVDILSAQGVYVPRTPEVKKIVPHDLVLSDLVFGSEPNRRFAVSELREGRLPIWSPFEFCGSPSFRHPLSPSWFLNYLIESPIALAWSQVILSVFAGVGAYAFFRRSLGVSFWPAAIASWCFPISGTFIIWQGGGSPPVVACLPWLLVSVDQVICRPRSWGGPVLALVTFATLISGAPDVAGQVLLVSGLFALWRYVDHYRRKWSAPRSALSLLAAGVGWAMGILMSLPVLLPIAEYSATGARIVRRSHGSEDRPPVGLAALPQTVLPEMYGTSQKGSLRLVRGVHPESSAGAYAGLLATLVAAPLAWRSRRYRSRSWFWLVIGFLGMAWPLNVPGLVDLFRLPGMNLMSFNRFVFATTFAILSLVAMGLDSLGRGERPGRRWSWLPVGILIALLGWCFYRTVVPPDSLPRVFAEALLRDPSLRARNEQAALFEIEDTFFRTYWGATVISALGIGAWLLLLFRRKPSGWIVPGIGMLMVGELLRFGYGVSSQCDPNLYFPRIPMLEEIAKAPAGRVIGYECLYPNLSRIHGLRDVRGYDGVDPARMVQLLACGKEENRPVLRAAATLYLVPKMELAPPDGVLLHPVMDMLNVRYILFRGEPPEGVHPPFSGSDYWALANPGALPRVFVPKRVETVVDGQARLEKLADRAFSPRDIAYVEEPVSLPDACAGTATIQSEVPRQISVSVDMETPGLVVLSDLWDKGWHAYLDGREVPILITNHAVRGVVAPAGVSQLEFRYEPASMNLGLKLAGFASLFLLGWALLNGVRRPPPTGEAARA